MASNLLALLNFSSAQTPASSASSAQPSNEAPSSLPPNSSSTSLSLPPTTSGPDFTANTLLQSFLGPNTQSQSKPIQNPTTPTPSSPASSTRKVNLIIAPSDSPTTPTVVRSPPSSAAPGSAIDLLALLTGTGSKVSNNSEENEGDTSFHEQAPRPKMQPIGTPPGQNTRKDLAKSPVSSMFESANMFDRLIGFEGRSESRPPSITSREKESTAEVPQEASVKNLNAPPHQLLQALSQARPTALPRYNIARKMHASYHLSGLHASAGFDDDVSNGMTMLEIDGIQHFTLDLGAPQPGGLSSLYPAKLEITAVSLLTTPFAPSIFINEESEQSKVARWPSQRVAGMAGTLVMYVMSKGRIRVIDQKTGDRILARADSTIRSVFTAGDKVEESSKRLFAATTQEGGLSIWNLEDHFGQAAGDVPIIAQLFAEKGKQFIYASWRSNSRNEEMIVVQSDGQIALFKLADLQKESQNGSGKATWSLCPKKNIALEFASDQRVVGTSTSSDGSLLAVVVASSLPLQSALQLYLVSLTCSVKKHTVSLPSLAQLGCSNISFVSFANNGTGQIPRGLLVGFDDNQVVALIDLTSGSLRQLYRFQTTPNSPSFSLAAWHSATSSLLLGCSLRSSIFSLRLRFSTLPLINSGFIAKAAGLQDETTIDESCEVLYRVGNNLLPFVVLDSRPALRECALPEPYTCLALDNSTTVEGSIRVLASHIGGIHALLIPEEALVQTVVQKETKGEVEAPPSKLEERMATFPSEIKVEKEDPPLPPMEVQTSRQEVLATSPLPEVTIEPSTKVAASKENGFTSTPKASEIKKKGNHNRTASKNAKIDKNLFNDNGAPRSTSTAGVQSTDDATRINREEIKTLFAQLEASFMDKMNSHLQSKEEQQSSTEIAHEVVANLTPMISSLIDDLLPSHLQQAVDAAVSRSLSQDLHNLLLRPDFSLTISKSITSSILPPIQKTAMDVVSRVLAPHFENIMTEMTSRVEAKIDMGITGIRKDIIMEQSKALLETEASLNEINVKVMGISDTMQALLQQNSKLEKALEELHFSNRKSSSPSDLNGSIGHRQEILGTFPAQTPLYQGFPLQLSSTSIPPPLPSAPSFHQPYATFPSQSPQITSNQSRQASYNYSQPHSAPLPYPSAPIPQQQDQSPGMKSQEVEDTLLTALSSPNIDSDTSLLQNALSNISSKCGSPISAIWEKSASGSETVSLGKPRISQAVILTLLHRLIQSLNGSSDQSGLKVAVAVPWIEACAAALDKNDEVISRYYDHIKGNMINSLIQAHTVVKSRAPWWTDDRLSFGILRFIQ